MSVAVFYFTKQIAQLGLRKIIYKRVILAVVSLDALDSKERNPSIIILFIT